MHGACKTPGMVNGGMRNIDACLYVRPSDRTTLERLVADGKTAQKIVARARIVLLSGRGFGTNSIQREARVSKPTVWRWQKAYMDGGVERLLKDRGTACRNARTRSGSRLTNGPRAIAVAVVGGNYRIFLCKKDRRAGQINKTALVLEQLPTRGACSRIAAERLQCLSALVPYISATSLSQISNFEWRGSCAGRVSRGPRRLPYPACDVSWIARERLSESCRTMPNGMEPARRSGAFAGRRGGLRSISILAFGIVWPSTARPGRRSIVALIAGILILIMPSMLNYIVAIYLIVVGLIGLNGIPFHQLNTHRLLCCRGRRRTTRSRVWCHALGAHGAAAI